MLIKQMIKFVIISLFVILLTNCSNKVPAPVVKNSITYSSTKYFTLKDKARYTYVSKEVIEENKVRYFRRFKEYKQIPTFGDYSQLFEQSISTFKANKDGTMIEKTPVDTECNIIGFDKKGNVWTCDEYEPQEERRLLYKNNSRLGEAFVSKTPREKEIKSWVDGFETVKTPAGIFKNCLKLVTERTIYDIDFTYISYIAPSIGPVKNINKFTHGKDYMETEELERYKF